MGSLVETVGVAAQRWKCIAADAKAAAQAASPADAEADRDASDATSSATEPLVDHVPVSEGAVGAVSSPQTPQAAPQPPGDEGVEDKLLDLEAQEALSHIQRILESTPSTGPSTPPVLSPGAPSGSSPPSASTGPSTSALIGPLNPSTPSTQLTQVTWKVHYYCTKCVHQASTSFNQMQVFGVADAMDIPDPTLQQLADVTPTCCDLPMELNVVYPLVIYEEPPEDAGAVGNGGGSGGGGTMFDPEEPTEDSEEPQEEGENDEEGAGGDALNTLDESGIEASPTTPADSQLEDWWPGLPAAEAVDDDTSVETVDYAARHYVDLLAAELGLDGEGEQLDEIDDDASNHLDEESGDPAEDPQSEAEKSKKGEDSEESESDGFDPEVAKEPEPQGEGEDGKGDKGDESVVESDNLEETQSEGDGFDVGTLQAALEELEDPLEPPTEPFGPPLEDLEDPLEVPTEPFGPQLLDSGDLPLWCLARRAGENRRTVEQQQQVDELLGCEDSSEMASQGSSE